MDEESNNKLLRQADTILIDLQKETDNLPQDQVWYCKSEEEIQLLVSRMEECVKNYYSLMAGTCDETRQMLLKMINIITWELTAAKAVLHSLERK